MIKENPAIFSMPEGFELVEHLGMPTDKMLVDTEGKKVYVQHLFPIVFELGGLDAAVRVACGFARRRLMNYINSLPRDKTS